MSKHIIEEGKWDFGRFAGMAKFNVVNTETGMIVKSFSTAKEAEDLVEWYAKNEPKQAHEFDARMYGAPAVDCTRDTNSENEPD